MSPTYARYSQFQREYDKLTPVQKSLFQAAVRALVEDLKTGQFRKNLRIKRVQGYEGVWEMTWAPDGRATFHYGPEVQPGQAHIVWRRVGTHDIFRQP